MWLINYTSIKLCGVFYMKRSNPSTVGGVSSRDGTGGQDEGLLLICSFPVPENKLRRFYNIPCTPVFTFPKKSYSISHEGRKQVNSSKDDFKTGPYMYSWGSVNCPNLSDYLLK